MAFKRTGKNLCSFDPKTDSVIFNRRDCGLRNACELCELILAELLKLPNDANGLTNAYGHAALGWTKLTHYGLR